MKIVSIIVLLITFSIISFPQQTILVDAATIWQSTGISVGQNETVLFIAKGSWSYAGNSYDEFVGPEGTESWQSNPSDFLVPEVNHMSLVGKIGENGTPFGIGSHNKVISTDGGEIFLSMNDKQSGFSDNSGYLVVAVYTNTLTNLRQGQSPRQTPDNSYIYQNYPNPFNPSTSIDYVVSKASKVKIDIYDINGQIVRSLTNGIKNPGQYSEKWDGTNNNGSMASSGSYFYQVQIGNYIQTKKMILMK